VIHSRDVIYQTRLIIRKSKNVGLMNQAATRNRLRDTKSGLMNQAPTMKPQQ